MNEFAGLRVIVSAPRPRRRTWTERLFTLPWIPWKRWKVVPAVLGPDDIVRFGNTLVVGQRAYDRLKKAANGGKSAEKGPIRPYSGLPVDKA